MCHPNGLQSMKAKKLKKGCEISVLGRMCRVTRVHKNPSGTVTVHVRTFGLTNPDHFTAHVDENSRVVARPRPKK